MQALWTEDRTLQKCDYRFSDTGRFELRLLLQVAIVCRTISNFEVHILSRRILIFKFDLIGMKEILMKM